MVGLPLRGVRTPCGQSGSLCGLKLVPSKQRYLIPPTIGRLKIGAYCYEEFNYESQLLVAVSAFTDVDNL